MGLHIFPSVHERRIARRYLFRYRRSRVVLVLSALLGLGAIASITSYFIHPAQHTLLGASLSVLAPLVFIAVALLNLFSVFSTVAVIGVMLGVAALTVVMAVTSGFQREIQNRVIGVNAHVLVLKYGTDFHEHEDIIKKVAAHAQVLAAAPFVYHEMLIAKEAGSSSGVLVKGIDPLRSARVLDLESRLLPGPGGARPGLGLLALDQAPDGGGPPLPGLFIGRELARKLKARAGDRVRLIAPLLGMDGSIIEELGGSGNPLPPRSIEFRVAAVFAAGFDEYDRRLVYVEMRRAQELVGQGNVVTGVEMVVRRPERARQVARDLDRLLGGAPYRTLDWEELNQNLFTALAMQKIVLLIVLFLIVLVAAFNIVASLTMMVLDKTREIAIFKAMGMSSPQVAAVFRSAGMAIGVTGTCLGIGMGLLVCQVVRRLGYLLDARVYLIDQLPIQVSAVEVLVIALVTVVICFLATLYPSLRAARLPPVDGLRYE